MDEIVYQALSSFYHVLEVKGYMADNYTKKLLLLVFYKDYIYRDYRGILSNNDYRMIDMALECLYGSTCLIPYPDYLKMGKLHLGEMTEIAHRVKTLEDTKVLKAISDLDSVENTPDSDVLIIEEEDEE